MFVLFQAVDDAGVNMDCSFKILVGNIPHVATFDKLKNSKKNNQKLQFPKIVTDTYPGLPFAMIRTDKFDRGSIVYLPEPNQ